MPLDLLFYRRAIPELACLRVVVVRRIRRACQLACAVVEPNFVVNSMHAISKARDHNGSFATFSPRVCVAEFGRKRRCDALATLSNGVRALSGQPEMIDAPLGAGLGLNMRGIAT